MSALTVAEAVEAADFGTPSARKSGRDPRWPYVPMIVGGDSGRSGWHQVMGLAYATRQEAIDAAARHIDRLRADLARKLAEPRYRALRAQYGVDG